ncbi:MAG: DUF4474 domain-containing protein [Acutalibacteraceae bacterium]|nr:DUF4474 domain-containing protein [Acutalibacteraceae bacterium]
MKKYARVFSMLALILAITFVFSGCGVIDFAKSILIKEEATTTPDTTVSGEIVYTDDATNSVVITPPSDTTTVTQPAAGNTSSATTQATTSTSVDTTEVKKPVATTEGKKPATTVPTTEKIPTAAEIQEMPLKDVQDLLFASDSADKTVQILSACGFEYDEKQGIYYSSVNPWQKGFGFNVIYDMSAPLAGMYYATERVYFQYDNKDWMIQIWKGQYGMTAGAEIGIYNKTDKIMQYDCVSEEEFLEMSFVLYNQGEKMFERGPEKHWWLTGFKILNIGVPILLDMDMTIKFPTKSMADAFEAGLKKANRDNLLDPMTYTRGAKSFTIHW